MNIIWKQSSRFGHYFFALVVVLSSVASTVKAYATVPTILSATVDRRIISRRYHVQPLNVTPWLEGAVPSDTVTMILGDSTTTSTICSISNLHQLDLGPGLLLMMGLMTIALMPLIVAEAGGIKQIADILSFQTQNTMSEKEEINKPDSKRKGRRVLSVSVNNNRDVSTTKSYGIGRRGTIMTFVGSAASFVASDMLLGASGKVVGREVSFLSSKVSPYDARWNAMYKRLAAGGVTASPDLVDWVAKSRAAATSPKLKAWVAAQRALLKSRQIMTAATGLEEGIAAATATAVALAAKDEENDTSDDSPYVDVLVSDDGDVEKEEENSLMMETDQVMAATGDPVSDSETSTGNEEDLVEEDDVKE